MNEFAGYFKQVENFIPNNGLVLENLKIGRFIQKFISNDTLLEYFEIADVGKILSLHTRTFCKIPPTYVIFSQITGIGSLEPHKDHGPQVSLNYYIEAGIDKTIFYQKKDEHLQGTYYPGKEEANIYESKDLLPITEFVSSSNESYLLNVSKIHSVQKLTNHKRIFLTYAWHDNTYEEVLENLC